MLKAFLFGCVKGLRENDMMLPQDLAAIQQSVPPGMMNDANEPRMPLELLELELSLEGFKGGEDGFREAVREAASAVKGEFLFDLPAAGLVDNCRRLAVLRIPDEDVGMRVVLALLDEEGSEIRLQEPDEDTEHLVRFADAFVDVLQLMPEKKDEAETAAAVHTGELESVD
jgi:hypothetical protein